MIYTGICLVKDERNMGWIIGREYRLLLRLFFCCGGGLIFDLKSEVEVLLGAME
jgi:hypothetical protein